MDFAEGKDEVNDEGEEKDHADVGRKVSAVREEGEGVAIPPPMDQYYPHKTLTTSSRFLHEATITISSAFLREATGRFNET